VPEHRFPIRFMGFAFFADKQLRCLGSVFPISLKFLQAKSEFSLSFNQLA